MSLKDILKEPDLLNIIIRFNVRSGLLRSHSLYSPGAKGRMHFDKPKVGEITSSKQVERRYVSFDLIVMH